jgi:LysR family transcriptional regulator, glycine cleavage system transcriptional activator
MTRRLPPLHALAAFVAVARHRSFLKAAHELCVTPSAISHRIKALETHFETTLFSRHSSTVRITPQGELILEAVMSALATLEGAHQTLKHGDRKVVRVSVGQGFARNWLIERLGAFYRLHRDIDLELNGARAATAKIDSLRSGEADVAIHDGQPEAKGLERVEILRCQVFPVCSPDYRASLPDPDDARALLDANLLRVSRQPWRPWFKAAGLVCQEPDHGPLFSDSGLMVDAAVRGQGVALARDVLIQHDVEMGRLVRLCNVAVSCAYFAVYLPKADTRPEVAAFLGWISTLTREGALLGVPTAQSAAR